MTTFADLTRQAELVMTDPGNVRWSNDEMLLWLNDGLVELVNKRPSAYVQQEKVTLKPGVSQVLPPNARILMSLDEAYTAGGVPVGVPALVSRSALSTLVPRWRKVMGAAVREYCYGPGDPTRFLVFPGAMPGAEGAVLMTYSALPPRATSLGEMLPVGDEYVPMLLNYLLFRMYSKDADFAGNAQLAQAYYTLFTALATGT